MEEANRYTLSASDKKHLIFNRLAVRRAAFKQINDRYD